jgi:hypothetical protein
MSDGLGIPLAENSNDARMLEYALLPLAVGRCGPLLALSGLPLAIVKSPQELRELSRDAISAVRASRSSSGDEVGQDDAIRVRSIAAFVDGATAAYGPHTAAELLDWLRCLHLDRASRDALTAWARVLQLAAGMRSLDSGSPRLDPSVQQVLVDLAKRGFGPIANANLNDASSAAFHIPLSHPEERLLAMEVSQVGDVDQWDVVQDMELNARMSTARKIRASMKDRLAPTQFRTVVSWARELLETRGEAFGAKALTSDPDCGAPQPGER